MKIGSGVLHGSSCAKAFLVPNGVPWDRTRKGIDGEEDGGTDCPMSG